MLKKNLTSRLQQIYAQLPYLPQALALVWGAARGWTIIWGVLLLIQGLLPAATVYLTREVVNSLASALESSTDVGRALLLVALMAGLMLFKLLLGGVSSWVQTMQSEKVQDHLYELVHTQAMTLDLAFYEAPGFYNRLHRARHDAMSRPLALVGNIGTLLQNSLTLLAMAGILLPFGLWLPPMLLLSVFPAFLIVWRYTLRQNEWRLRTTSDVRRMNYYEQLLTTRYNAAEVRLFGLGKHFQQGFQALREKLRGERLAIMRDETLAQLMAGSLSLLITGLVMGVVVWQALPNGYTPNPGRPLGQEGSSLTLGDLALFYQAFNQGQGLMRTLLSNVGSIYTNLLFLENMFEFLALRPQITDPPQPVPMPTETSLPIKEGIRLEKISFRYPGSERCVLNNFNLSIPAGKMVAIVGENGAGKSTLIKLICRLYDPEAGQITIDGTNLQEFALDDLRRQITILFQEPVHYHTTAAENIWHGDISTPLSKAKIEAAAEAAAADTPINRLPEGYENILGKRFGGTELSGGEWQRVALARAFLRQAPIIILDEPTSAMDSWAEADWMARFRDLTAGRTSIIITHRFTTAMQADIIHVMMGGQLVESGSHEELLALGGRYAQSWRAQMG